MSANSQLAENEFPRGEAPEGSGALSFRARGQGAAVVFLHGVGLNKDAWREQEAFFFVRRKTVVCDLPGHGDSPLPAAVNPALSDYSAPVAELMDQLGLRQADIAGHSFGGLVALDFALRFPNRVRRLVVLNGVFCRSPDARKAVARRADALAKGEFSEAAETALRRWFGKPESGEARNLTSEVRNWLARANPAGYARAYRLFAESDAVFAERLCELNAPALFATGENDPHSTPEMSREMARRAPQGECRILPNQRHMMALSAPDIVNPALAEFLEPR